jgi:predicted RNase H-like HicB family nuclease
MVLIADRDMLNAPPQVGYDVDVVPETIEGRTIYVARNPDLPHCFSQGDAPEEALENLRAVREEFLHDMAADHIPVPPPKQNPREVILRVTGLHDAAPDEPRIYWRRTG